jgi:hypothetical protein
MPITALLTVTDDLRPNYTDDLRPTYSASRFDSDAKHEGMVPYNTSSSLRILCVGVGFVTVK